MLFGSLLYCLLNTYIVWFRSKLHIIWRALQEWLQECEQGKCAAAGFHFVRMTQVCGPGCSIATALDVADAVDSAGQRVVQVLSSSCELVA
jgi:hypothetical protein